MTLKLHSTKNSRARQSKVKYKAPNVAVLTGMCTVYRALR